MTSTGEAARCPRDINAPVAFRVDPNAVYLFDAATSSTLAQASFALSQTPATRH